ncbi:hypothetical protein [Streptomyces sp. NPDC101237]|uniref:hypothetical protein n=1 Tax=Streptomyces sp. NPDC101237 TaxID=3366139 RepID=UPI00381B6359
MASTVQVAVYDATNPEARDFVWSRVKENHLDPYGITAPRRPAPGRPEKTRWRGTAAPARFLTAVRENQEVVPVNTLTTWVLPSGVTVGR